MRTLRQVSAALRRRNIKNYYLLIICCLFSVMLITTYVSMMRAPTVLAILPEGGDSRKQVMMIFVLAVVGCGVFTAYAASLFFRFKSREMGILMALGTSRKQIRNQLFAELALISVSACLIGALLGTPLAWCIWKVFRVLLIDTQEMVLSFDPQAYLFAGAFSLFTIITLFAMGIRFIRRTDIMDIVNQQRKSEPIHDVKPWFGPLGIALIVIGGFGGYITPTICIRVLQFFPPAWVNITYLPLFIGIYMVLLHTIVRGWHRGNHRYKDIITRSMMKFQGRQTVRNMLVITLLLAGAYFASFYTPLLATSATMEVEQRSIDYMFHYRTDQAMLTESEIRQMADNQNVTITSWLENEFANLAYDGELEKVSEGGKINFEYQELIGEGNFLSESCYNEITSQTLDVQSGKIVAVIAEDGAGKNMISVDMTQLTNAVTGKTLSVAFQDYAGANMLATDYYVLDDNDYRIITIGLTDEWKETLVDFNVENVDETYPFAKQLYNAIIDCSGPECEIPEYYDRIGKMVAEEKGEIYWGDTEDMTKISYDERDSFAFKTFWKYVPRFRVLDANDFVTTFAVFLMLFIFISIICFAAVLVIAYTRCITIALNNRQVYDDLKRLGANRAYQYQSVRSQISKVYGVPAAVGTIMMYALYVMIMYFNDNSFTQNEIAGLGNCLLLIVAMSFLIWCFYRFTLRRVCRALEI